MNLLKKYFFYSLQVLLFACSGTPPKYSDTPTSGEIFILADESYEPIIKVQLDTFMEIYKYAKINVKYLPESELFNQLLNNDTVRIAVTARDLSDDEKKHFDEQKIIPRSLKVASDALALIVNKNNHDTLISYEKLKNIIAGDIQTWKPINKNGRIDSIKIVYDKSGSANARYLKEKFLPGKNLTPNSYATQSNAEVVEYVSQHYGALGVIGVNWISDRDGEDAVKFLDKVNVVALSMPDSAAQQQVFNKPFQAYIALKEYPLIRNMYIIIREGRNGLGTGFASFVAGDKGQRLIRMMGLLPATMPVRIIHIN